MLQQILTLYREKRLPAKYYILRRKLYYALLMLRIRICRKQAFLSLETLEKQATIYKPKKNYKFDNESVYNRGKERAEEIQRIILPLEKARSCEIGCGDGMVSYHLSKLGLNTVAIDKSNWQDERVLHSNVKFIKCNRDEGLNAASNAFDIVFSYNAMEHFVNPQSVFGEMIRICKPGGHILLSFAPLYYSRWGLHAFDAIGIPYVQFLFPIAAVNQYIRKHLIFDLGSERNTLQFMNKLTIKQWREIWSSFKEEIETLEYKEEYDHYADLKIIWKYPWCFKHVPFESLLVNGIRAIYKKR